MGKNKPKTFAEQLMGVFTPSKKSEGNTHPREHGSKKDDRPSIAERINWGGQYSDKKKGKGKR